MTPTYLRFAYVNWRGDGHVYVIEPEGISFGKPERHWYLNGQVITRDSDPRPEMSPTRRRSFRLDQIRELREVEAASV